MSDFREKIYQLIGHGEGFVPRPYQDKFGLWTFGIGRCYERYPLTLAERRRVVEVAPMSADPDKPWDLDKTTFILSQLPSKEAGIIASFLVFQVLDEIIPRLESHFPWFQYAKEAYRAVWIDWAYNMGLYAVKSWNNTPIQFAQGKFSEIAKDCLTWPWAEQVGKNPPNRDNPYGQRAWYISEMIRTGEWPVWLK